MPDLDLAGERLRVLPERALLWSARATVFVADLHLGKSAAFAAAGVPVPSGTTGADLDDLGQLLDRTRAERLVILGDLLHARASREPHTLTAFARWRAARPSLRIELIRGNHDDRAGDPPEDWGIRTRDDPSADAPFVLAHRPPPPDYDGPHVLCGHVHPQAHLLGPARLRHRLPCLVVGPHRTILPAFGRFTGGHVHTPAPGERLFIFGPDAVVEPRLTAPPPRRPRFRSR